MMYLRLSAGGRIVVNRNIMLIYGQSGALIDATPYPPGVAARMLWRMAQTIS